MAPTSLADLDRLPLPGACREALALSRSERIDGHTIAIAADWWNAETAAADPSASPVADPGVVRLRRGDLFTDAAGLAEGPDAELLRFLWQVLAWGSGMRLRLNRKRIQAVANDRSSALTVLRRALQAVDRKDPAGAYEALHPGQRNAIAYLGPAFSTKVLYFAGGGAPGHACVILDARVAATLREACGWSSLGSTRWPTATYVRYCELLQRWAAEESARVGRPVGSDEIERWLFSPLSD
ncbi:hypothetical protein AB0M42_10685 [Streptomyces sp. NPDC051784]|uniref:8-oxoguanine DNA glycosylase OGG fold protein n=1 Tax=Streptomyces sp. NPDC051784 TaxID=3155805 RepID=UPI0034499FFB